MHDRLDGHAEGGADERGPVLRVVDENRVVKSFAGGGQVEEAGGIEAWEEEEEDIDREVEEACWIRHFRLSCARLIPLAEPNLQACENLSHY